VVKTIIDPQEEYPMELYVEVQLLKAGSLLKCCHSKEHFSVAADTDV
jgi:hypothetical protein